MSQDRAVLAFLSASNIEEDRRIAAKDAAYRAEEKLYEVARATKQKFNGRYFSYTPCFKRDFEGRPLKQYAAELGVSYGCVLKRVKRGLRPDGSSL